MCKEKMTKNFDLDRIDSEMELCVMHNSIKNEYLGRVILDIIDNEVVFNRYYKRYGEMGTDYYIRDEMQINILTHLLKYNPDLGISAYHWLTRLAKLGANKGIQKFYVLKNGFGDSLEVDENRLDPVEDFELYKIENDIKL